MSPLGRSLALLLLAGTALTVGACNRGTDAAPSTSAAPSSAPSSAPAATVAAKPVDSAMVDRYSAHGTVKSVDVEKKKLSIAHDDIPGFMKAMTMPFEVRDGALLSGIAAGDVVDFSFTDDGSGHLVIDKLVKK